MPMRSKRPCSVPGCPVLTSERWCPTHKTNKHVARPYDDRRGSSAQRGYDKAWVRLRAVKLRQTHYLCEPCLAKDRPTPATEVHHKIPIAVDPTLRLVIENLLSVCHTCHMRLEAEIRQKS